MRKTWIKLYHEILSDEKMGTMSDHLFRRTIELFLVAGQNDKAGLLPDVDGIAWTLHTNKRDIQKTLSDLISLGIVGQDEDKQFRIVHFYDRQMSNKSEAEKKAEQRAKQKDNVPQENRTDENEKKGTMSSKKKGQCPPELMDKVPSLEKEKEKEEEKEKEINFSANAEKCGGGKLQPEDPQFWQRAFGPNAEMAQAFWKTSGILPVKSEFGRWQKELREFAEAGITIPQMEAAIAKMKADRLTIGAPGSVLKIARSLASPQPASHQPKAQGGVNEFPDMYSRMKAMQEAGQL